MNIDSKLMYEYHEMQETLSRCREDINDIAEMFKLSRDKNIPLEQLQYAEKGNIPVNSPNSPLNDEYSTPFASISILRAVDMINAKLYNMQKMLKEYDAPIRIAEVRPFRIEKSIGIEEFTQFTHNIKSQICRQYNYLNIAAVFNFKGYYAATMTITNTIDKSRFGIVIRQHIPELIEITTSRNKKFHKIKKDDVFNYCIKAIMDYRDYKLSNKRKIVL